jgi:hypothetical protein
LITIVNAVSKPFDLVDPILDVVTYIESVRFICYIKVVLQRTERDGIVGYHYALIVDAVLGQVDAKHIGNSRLDIAPVHVEGSCLHVLPASKD